MHLGIAQTLCAESKWWCKPLMMYNRRSRNGVRIEVNERSSCSVIGDHHDCRWRKQEQRTRNEAGKQTSLWKTKHGMCTNKSSLNPPGAESRKQILNICVKIWIISIFIMRWGGVEGRRLCVCVQDMWCDSPHDTTVTFWSSPGGRIEGAALPWMVPQLSAWVQSLALLQNNKWKSVCLTVLEGVCTTGQRACTFL